MKVMSELSCDISFYTKQQMSTCKDIQQYSFIYYTDMFRSFLWPSSGYGKDTTNTLVIT
jgi:hypothetical protein